MSAEWQTVELGEHTDMLTGFPFKSSEYSSNQGIPLIRGDNVAQGRLRWDGVKYWPADKVSGIEQYLVSEQDVILAMDRPWIEAGLKYAAITKSDTPSLLVQRVARLRGKDKLDTRFLKYIIGSRAFTDYVLGIQTGTSIPHISGGQIRAFKFKLPPLSEQKAIAQILGTLDDKIELNRKMNETLEAMARALFKSWFVDFDPVRRNMARRRRLDTPTRSSSSGAYRDAGGHSTTAARHRRRLDTPRSSSDPKGRIETPRHSATADDIDALFPGEFEDSALGEIPKGWRVGKLPEAFEINPTRSLSQNMNAPYLEMSNMPTDRAREEGFVLRPFGSGMKFINGDTLIARITPCLENGKTCFVDFLNDGEVGWGSTEYIVLRSKPPLGLSMSYFLARDENFRAFAISNMTGTTGRQRVPAESLTGYEVIIPPAELCGKFEEFSNNIFKKLKATDAETRELTAIRDTLLPKLISGELRAVRCDPSSGLRFGACRSVTPTSQAKSKTH